MRSSKSDSLFPFPDSFKKTQRREAQCKLYERQCEVQKLKTEAEDDAEESDVAEDFCRSKSRAVCKESPIKPKKFANKCLNRWGLWVRHHKSVVKANGWSDMQAIEALPACLTSWAVEEIETVPRHYVAKVRAGVEGEKTPQFDALLAVLEPKMKLDRSKRTALSEFKAVNQMENESLKDYSRRVRFWENWQLQKNHSQKEIKNYVIIFLGGVLDFRLQENFYEDETDRNFCEVFTGP